MRNVFFFICCSLLSCDQSRKSTDAFENRKAHGRIKHASLTEASGLVASIQNSGYVWTHNDSGNPSELFLLDDAGNVVLTVILPGIVNRDWEDIGIGPGPMKGKTYLYVGDIGDNNAVYDYKYIYRIEEPVLADTSEMIVREVDTFIIELSDGKRDSEALFVDPVTGDIYLFSKREKMISGYKISAPYSADDTLMADKIVSLPLFNLVAADISGGGTEILMKTYDEVLYWRRTPDQKLEDVLSEDPVKLPYDPEPQGEAIAWSRDGSGYYTLSEDSPDERAVLFFYKRKE